MKQIKGQVFVALGLAAIAALSIAPVANAVEFRLSAVQERKDEVVVIEDDIIANFRELERARLEALSAEADVTAEDTAQVQADNEVARLSFLQ